jgi:hypothetical protein
MLKNIDTPKPYQDYVDYLPDEVRYNMPNAPAYQEKLSTKSVPHTTFPRAGSQRKFPVEKPFVSCIMKSGRRFLSTFGGNEMNLWTQRSVEYANQRNYLDQLFRVYPLEQDDIRDIDKSQLEKVEEAFGAKDKMGLLTSLLSFELFPIKDSYVAYLKRDPSALQRNPATVDRLCGRLFDMGLKKILEECSQPKETNRQIGPLFRRWVANGNLGTDLLAPDEFVKTDKNAVLKASDAETRDFANRHLNYKGEKGLDLLARFNKKYVVGEAKFLTDFGGHQNAQFKDALALLKNKTVNAVKVAILDGVLYIPGNNVMHKFLKRDRHNHNIMSALVLREFLYQI